MRLKGSRADPLDLDALNDANRTASSYMLELAVLFAGKAEVGRPIAAVGTGGTLGEPDKAAA